MEVKHHSNKKIGIMIFVGFLLIVIGIISYVVINYINDNKKVKERMDYVIDNYNVFKSDVDSFNDIRDKIYDEVMIDIYYQTLKDNDTYFKELFNEYESKLELIDDDYKKLKKRCVNVLYPNASVNNKCEALIIGYEEVVNTYISDVTSYNENIKSYNEWLKDTESSDSPLDEIKLERDFIDINGDREYSGKKESTSSINDNVDSLDSDGDMPDE